MGSLVEHNTVLEIVNAYRQCEADISAAYAQIEAATDSINKALNPKYTIGLTGRHHTSMRFNAGGLEDALKELRRDVWRCLIERLELSRIMSMSRWKSFNQQVTSDIPPPIDVETIQAFGRMHLELLPTMIDESVKEVFGILRPHRYWRGYYKTNSEFEVGAKVILESYVKPAWIKPNRFDVQFSQNLTALENVFSMLAGNGFVNKSHSSMLEIAINAAPDGIGETDFFEFKCYKKGTLHLKFKRPDLVLELNKRAGALQLKPKEK